MLYRDSTFTTVDPFFSGGVLQKGHFWGFSERCACMCMQAGECTPIQGVSPVDVRLHVRLQMSSFATGCLAMLPPLTVSSLFTLSELLCKLFHHCNFSVVHSQPPTPPPVETASGRVGCFQTTMSDGALWLLLGEVLYAWMLDHVGISLFFF